MATDNLVDEGSKSDRQLGPEGVRRGRRAWRRGRDAAATRPPVSSAAQCPGAGPGLRACREGGSGHGSGQAWTWPQYDGQRISGPARRGRARAECPPYAGVRRRAECRDRLPAVPAGAGACEDAGRLERCISSAFWLSPRERSAQTRHAAGPRYSRVVEAAAAVMHRSPAPRSRSVRGCSGFRQSEAFRSAYSGLHLLEGSCCLVRLTSGHGLICSQVLSQECVDLAVCRKMWGAMSELLPDFVWLRRRDKDAETRQRPVAGRETGKNHGDFHRLAALNGRAILTPIFPGEGSRQCHAFEKGGAHGKA